MSEHITQDGEIVTEMTFGGGNQSIAIALSKAEIDQQITTAHAYPRSVQKVQQRVTSLVLLDEKSAEECVYALPRGNKPIQGPSIRLAEIIAGQWGNCRVGSRVVHVDRIEKYIEAEGIFHDLETNTAQTARVRRRISDSKGRLYNDDMIIVTGNAACSVARRNAILAGVPKPIWRDAYDSAIKLMAGDIKTLEETRERWVKAFAHFGVKPETVFTALGVSGMNDIGIEHIATIKGTYNALKSGEITVEEAFYPKDAASDAQPKIGMKQSLSNLAIAASGNKHWEAGVQAADAPAKVEKTVIETAANEQIYTTDQLEEITRCGIEAKTMGMSIKAMPSTYNEAAKAAWLDGFNAPLQTDGAA